MLDLIEHVADMDDIEWGEAAKWLFRVSPIALDFMTGQLYV
jgi:hypothetical protein